MATLPTPAELTALARARLRSALDPTGTGAVDLRAGSRLDALVSVATGMGNRLSSYVADRMGALRRSTAQDEDLDVLARDLYSETRKPASYATGKVGLVRPGTAATLIPKGTRFGVPAAGSRPALVFVSTADVPSSSLTATVPVQAQQTGEASNVFTSAAITAILDSLPDPTWALDPSYIVPVSGGASAESNEVLRDRLAQLALDDTRQRGTRRAILRGALRVPGIRYATVVEPLNGTTLVFCGDSTYYLSETQALAVQQELLEWRALGVPALVKRYSVSTVPVTATLHMQRSLADYDALGLRNAAVEAVRRYFATRVHPDEYFQSAIAGAIGSVHPERQRVVLTSPSADVLRVADTAYASATTMARYIVDDSSITIAVAGPATL